MSTPSRKVVQVADYDLFVFGDSLSDISEFFTLTQGIFPPSPPYFNGRFANGPVTVDQLAEQLGINHTEATNFALAGALTDRTNSNSDLVPTLELGGLLDQIDQFSSQAGALGGDARDLYFIWAGANNILGLIANPVDDPLAVVNQAALDIASAVSSLVATGAETMIVALSPNVGRLPLSLEANVLESFTSLTMAFNTALTNTLTSLEATLAGTNIVLVDLFATSEAIAQDPTEFGFTNITVPYLSLEATPPTPDPDSFFFWDSVHPTTASHRLFTETTYDSLITQMTDDIRLMGTSDADTLIGFGGNDRLDGDSNHDEL
ncbi:MAG: SGNH/GDSL hydrolase family protein, partial [Leptolyngbyaceae cyanobacterium]